MKIILIILAFLLSWQSAYSIDCPPSSTCTTSFTTVVHLMSLDDATNGPSDLQASATMSYRVNCDGNFEVRIDDFAGRNGTNLDFLEELNIHQYNYSSASELVALDYIINNRAFNNDDPVPSCGTSTMTRVLVYTASCGIWTRCSY